MTITALTFRNVQCHERQEIALDAGVNVLLGKTDAGKSALIRGIRWLCRNRPAPAGLLRRGADELEVVGSVDGHVVKRRKTPSRNAYELDGEVYKALGAGKVPEAVTALLNVDDLNFAGQHDRPFLLSLSPPEAAKALNRVVNLELIDRTLGRLATMVRTGQYAVGMVLHRLRAAKDAKDALGWVPAAQAKLAAVEAVEARLAANRGRRERLAGLVAAAAALAGAPAVDLGIAGRKLDVLAELTAKIELAGRKRRRLESLVRQAETAEEERCRAKRRAAKAAKEFERHVGRRCPVCGRGDADAAG